MAWWTNPGIVIKSKSRFLLKIGSTTLYNVKSVSKPTVNVEKKEFRLTNHYYKYPGLVKWDPIEITMIDVDGLRKDKAIAYERRRITTSNRTEVEIVPVYTSANANTDGGYIPEGMDYNNYSWAGGAILNKLLEGGGYKNPDDSSSNNTLEKAAVMDGGFGGLVRYNANDQAIPTLSEIYIQQLDTSGDIIEEWTLHNPIFTKLAWGSLDYSSDDPVEYTVTVDYDWATFTHKNTIK